MLEQPVLARLAGCRRVLLAGCGGGYDVLGAVPLLAALRARGVDVSLASLSFTYLNGLDGARQDLEHPNLYEVDGTTATELKYCPEAWLARFLDERAAEPSGAGHVVHCFDKTGAIPLTDAYRALAARLQLDAIVLVDGGIDALLRGDERSIGTPSEDLASLVAVADTDVPTKLLACVGLGSEWRDGISHADALERVAVMTRRGAFLGAAALIPGTPETDLYRDALAYVFQHQADMKRSHVHAVIDAACRGEFGDRGPHVWLSPLMNLFWFFDATAVIADHAFLPTLRGTHTIWDVAARVEAARKELAIRPRAEIPI